MSLILEALKKSDAERSRARPAEPLQPSEERSLGGPGRWLLIAALVAMGSLGGWLGARWLEAPTGDDPTSEPSSDLEVVERTPEPTLETAPIQPAVAPPPTEVAAVTQAEPEPAAAPPVAIEQPAEPLPEQQPIAIEAPGAEGADTETMMPPETAVAMAEPAPEPPIAAPNPDPEDTAGLPTFSQLPASVRSDLGKLTLNIHVYDEVPDARFVLINLRRYREGDAVNNDLQIARIRPDGVVLDYRGQQFLLASRS